METVGFVILWFFAGLQVIGTIASAYTMGRPREPLSSNIVMAQAAISILFIYAVALVSVAR